MFKKKKAKDAKNKGSDDQNAMEEQTEKGDSPEVDNRPASQKSSSSVTSQMTKAQKDDNATAKENGGSTPRGKSPSSACSKVSKKKNKETKAAKDNESACKKKKWSCSRRKSAASVSSKVSKKNIHETRTAPDDEDESQEGDDMTAEKDKKSWQSSCWPSSNYCNSWYPMNFPGNPWCHPGPCYSSCSWCIPPQPWEATSPFCCAPYYSTASCTFPPYAPDVDCGLPCFPSMLNDPPASGHSNSESDVQTPCINLTVVLPCVPYPVVVNRM